MPMYEYECNRCGHLFSVLTLSSRRDEPQECPICKSKESERRVSVPAAWGASNSGSCGGSGRFT